MSVLGKKKVPLNMTTPMQLNSFCQVMQIYYEVLCAWYQVRRHVQGVKALCKQELNYLRTKFTKELCCDKFLSPCNTKNKPNYFKAPKKI
jgi:hypothetical protein